MHGSPVSLPNIVLPAGLQEGSDIICHGVDTLNTETHEVRKRIWLIYYLYKFSVKGLLTEGWNIDALLSVLLKLLGGEIHLKGDFTCIRRGRTYLSKYYQSSGKKLHLLLCSTISGMGLLFV